jgi:hypothetical protein
MTWFRASSDIIWIETGNGLGDEALAAKVLSLLRREGITAVS